MSGRLQRGFTLIEVMVATAVMVALAAGSLATSWRLVRNARDSADLMAAEAYCQQVFFVLLSNEKLIEKISSESWVIDPEKGLPKIVSENLFGGVTTNYPLWRTRSNDKRPRCTVKKEEKKIVVTVEWTDADGKEHEPPYSREEPLEPNGGAE